MQRRESTINHGSRRPQTETAGAHQREKPVVSSRQRGIKPQRKNAGGRKSQLHPYHPYPKASSLQSAVGGAHQESVSTATNEHARIDHQPSQQSSSARNELTDTPNDVVSRQSWQQEASDRDSWRSSVRKASCKFEAERHEAAK